MAICFIRGWEAISGVLNGLLGLGSAYGVGAMGLYLYLLIIPMAWDGNGGWTIAVN
jgi:hypothetical protein